MQKKSLTRALLEAIKENPGLTIRDLSELLGVDLARVREIIYRLKNEGLISKAGQGYVLTERGYSFLGAPEGAPQRAPSLLQYVTPSVEEEGRAEASAEVAKSAPVTQPVTRAEQERERPREDIEAKLKELADKVSELEKRLNELGDKVSQIEKALLAQTQRLQKREQLAISDIPVMSFEEAHSRLGRLLDKYLAEGRLVRVGSLIVDEAFYREFRSRFPIKVSDIEKMAPHEKALLEEMRREGIVVLHAGREYKLIE